MYITANPDRETNQARLTNILERMRQFLNDNRMLVNPTKTIIWEFMNKQKACKIKGNEPVLITRDSQGNIKEVYPNKNERCLGGTLQHNLTWQAMLDTGEDTLIPILRKKLGILKYLSKNIPQKSRLLLANSLLIGKINYLLPIYGGAPKKYLDQIQRIMNNSVRFITGASRREKSEKLMSSVNWLNIREMSILHTLVLTWKTLHLGAPQHLSDCIQLEQNNFVSTMNPRLKHTESSLRWRMCLNWNSLPPEIKEINSLQRFKPRAKKWISP